MAASASALSAGALYGWAVLRVRRWPRRRTACFLAGLVVLAVALGSAVDARADALLSAHVFQHLLLTMVAPALLVAGAPLTLALRALHGAPRAELARVMRGRLASVVTRPAVAWSLFAVVMVGSHVPAVYELALRHAYVHVFEHALYLCAAVIFWTPLLAAEPLPHRLGSVGAFAYLVTAMVPMTLVGVWLLSSGRVAYTHYAGAGALADQHAAGALMWVGGTMALVVALVAVAWTALAQEERRARSRERVRSLEPAP
jgi:putative membrane protein